MITNNLINDLCLIKNIRINKYQKSNPNININEEIIKRKISIIETPFDNYISIVKENLYIIGPFMKEDFTIEDTAMLFYLLYFKSQFTKKIIKRYRINYTLIINNDISKNDITTFDKNDLLIFLKDSILDGNIEVSKICIKLLLDTLKEEKTDVDILRLEKNLIIYIFSYIINIIENNNVDPDFNIFLTSIITSEFEYCENSSQLLFKTYQLIDKISDSFDFTSIKSQSKIKEAKYFITNNLEKKLTLEKVASEMGISAKYLSTLFFEITNTTFKEFLIKQRIEKAKNLLSFTNLSIDEVSRQIGINSSNNFISFFKKYTNSTPNNYREQN